MARAFIILLDSFGIGASMDAASFGDAGANTFLHIAEYCATNRANEGRHGPLHLPNFVRLGLNEALKLSCGSYAPGLPTNIVPDSAYGFASQISHGKDTPSGHWEMAGAPVLFEWEYYPKGPPSFSEALLNALIVQAELPGVLGNCHASGTDIIATLGEVHQRTGKPIVYTSADSVFQIAAHEESFGLERLYQVCAIARNLVGPTVGRVIARPFLGTPGQYYRTGNRVDYAIPPPAPTLLDHSVVHGREVIAIGKVSDIYAHRGTTQTIKADGNQALFQSFLQAVHSAPDGSLVFVNLVDFDMVFGHRRNVSGYAKALEDLDAQWPELEKIMQEDDWALITADHGCDPTWPGSDHTREHVPVLFFGKTVPKGPIGKRETFADMGQTIAAHLGVGPLAAGVDIFAERSCLS